MDSRRHRLAANPGDARRASARTTLVLGLVAVVLMAFRVSWNALSDVARTIGADSTAALLYPIVVDGLMALALVATLVLTGADRKFALRVLATYTISSLLLNYVHGLVPTLHTDSTQWGRLADWDPANWALVLLATSLPVGSIYFGSDLVAKVLHHTPESTDPAGMASAQSAGRRADELANPRASAQPARSNSSPGRAESGPARAPEPTPVRVADPSATEPTEADESAPATRGPRSAAAAGSTDTSPLRATGRVTATATAESAVDRTRTRTDADVLDEARLLTAGWRDERLTAKRLRSELRIAQTRARVVRDYLRAERAAQAEPTAYHGFGVEPLNDLGEAPSQQPKEPDLAPTSTT
ncbi:DUF2637 domain-containing protein [Streptomyces sp. NPDC088348]|uniref:DUF2637 domain-containing protein n=1 Tax=Streptomyces sp. NPDC088348 TaxID=3365853 RepID=UPI0037F7E351